MLDQEAEHKELHRLLVAWSQRRADPVEVVLGRGMADLLSPI